jgi:hypothetical protein
MPLGFFQAAYRGKGMYIGMIVPNIFSFILKIAKIIFEGKKVT